MAEMGRKIGAAYRATADLEEALDEAGVNLDSGVLSGVDVLRAMDEAITQQHHKYADQYEKDTGPAKKGCNCLNRVCDTSTSAAKEEDVDYELAQHIVDVLNDMVATDKSAVAALIANRVPCNAGLADHPTVQVSVQHDGFHVGLLGLLNGLCGVKRNGRGPIEAVFSLPRPDAWANLLKFQVMPTN